MSTHETDAVGGPVRRSNAVRIAAAAIGVVMALFVVMLFTSKNSSDQPSASPVIGQQAPALGGKALLGEPVDIGSNDRWLLVNFFATWCVPCVKEHPELRQFAENGAKDGSARVVSVAYDDEASAVKKFFEKQGGDWPVLDADRGRTALDWGVAKVPESFLVAPNGVVVHRLQGGVKAREVEALIERYEAQGRANQEGGS